MNHTIVSLNNNSKHRNSKEIVSNIKYENGLNKFLNDKLYKLITNKAKTLYLFS